MPAEAFVVLVRLHRPHAVTSHHRLRDTITCNAKRRTHFVIPTNVRAWVPAFAGITMRVGALACEVIAYAEANRRADPPQVMTSSADDRLPNVRYYRDRTNWGTCGFLPTTPAHGTRPDDKRLAGASLPTWLYRFIPSR
jgi:hypothetical protein